MRGLRHSAIGGMLLLVFLGSCGAVGSATAAEKWGPFRGRIVDAETGQPIPGAVVLAIWLELVDALVQTNTRFYDAREALTGPDGTFEVPRLPPPFFRFRITEPEFKLFAPGYAEHRWVVTPPTGEALIAPTVIEMRPLRTREERVRMFYRASEPSIPLEKRCLYSRALNQEAVSLGFTPLPECAR